MGFLLNGTSKQELTLKPGSEACIKDEITFTSEDLIEFKQALESYIKETNQTMNVKDLVNYFNKHFECNKIIDLLKLIVGNGFEVKPKLAYLPTTERCVVTKGTFVISKRPLEMNGYFFLNNLVVVKYKDNTFDFFTDVVVDPESRVCNLNNPNVNGVCYVSYNYLTNITL